LVIIFVIVRLFVDVAPSLFSFFIIFSYSGFFWMHPPCQPLLTQTFGMAFIIIFIKFTIFWIEPFLSIAANTDI
jgi:hypothetical protein